MSIDILVEDIKKFYKTIGELDGISERQLLKNNELNTIEHRDYLRKLVKKYKVYYKKEMDLSEDIYNMEIAIDDVFTEMMKNMGAN